MNIHSTRLREFVFLIAWIILNTLAFWLGWVSGGNDIGRDNYGRIAHNLYYGFVIGLAQWIAITLTQIFNKSKSPQQTIMRWLWPVLTALGFAFGVRAVNVFIHSLNLPHVAFTGLLFGIFIGGFVTLAQSSVLIAQGVRALLWWFCGSMIGWVSGEVLDSLLGYQGIVIPLTGTLIGLGSGIGLLGSIRSHSARLIRAINV